MWILHYIKSIIFYTPVWMGVKQHTRALFSGSKYVKQVCVKVHKQKEIIKELFFVQLRA